MKSILTKCEVSQCVHPLGPKLRGNPQPSLLNTHVPLKIPARVLGQGAHERARLLARDPLQVLPRRTPEHSGLEADEVVVVVRGEHGLAGQELAKNGAHRLLWKERRKGGMIESVLCWNSKELDI